MQNRMKMRRTAQLLALGLIYTLSSSPASCASINEQSENFFEQMLYQNLREEHNPHLTRLRRAAETTTGTRFKVGTCKLEKFIRSSKNCSLSFYKSVHAKGSSRDNCSAAYTTLRKCLLDTLKTCLEGRIRLHHLSRKDVTEISNNFMVFAGNEKFWCEKGGLGISSDFLPTDATCDPVFYHVAKSCTSRYSSMFNSSASDDNLCREYKKAKKCYLETTLRHCSFSTMLKQTLEMIIDITADFQPFCSETQAQEKLTIEKLHLDKTCPSYSLADVAFLLDVSNETDGRQFITMKRMLETVMERMDYGLRGIQISVFHFDAYIRTILKFGRVATKSVFQRHVRKMPRVTTTAKNKARLRMIGRSLSKLSQSTFSPNKGDAESANKIYKSGRRPYNPAVVFVMATGASSDSMVYGLEQLKDRNVHVVFVGPSSLKVPTTSDKIIQPVVPENRFTTDIKTPTKGSYRVIKTDFKLIDVGIIAKKITGEICTADSRKQLMDSHRITEGRLDDSKWHRVQSGLSRLGEYDLSLLFELNPIIAADTQSSFSSEEQGTATPWPPIHQIIEGIVGRNVAQQPPDVNTESTSPLSDFDFE